MKKVLALVLAVMMLATTAFAADEYVDGVFVKPNVSGNTYTARWTPGSTIDIIDAKWVEDNSNGEYVILDSGKTTLAEGEKLLKAINSTNYSISSVKVNDGRTLLDGNPKFNDDKEKVVLALKQDYSNTVEKKVNLTFTLKGKKVGGSKPADIKVSISFTVGYHLVENVLTVDSGNDTADIEDVDFKDKQNIYQVGGTANYGTLEFTAQDGDTDVEVRIYKDDKVYLYNNVDADKDILKKYADEDAEITFLNFPNTSFNATATVRFYKEEGTYIYENKEGNLTAITAEAASAGAAGQTAGKVKWDEDEGCYILKTRTLGNYVFSDVALPLDVANNTTDTPVTNPDTGANDVVGIATALAAVALVSAAAVSLKK